MDNNEFRIAADVKLIRQIAGLTQAELGKELGVDFATVNRWENSVCVISDECIEKLYQFAYGRGILLNRIKEQFFREESDPTDKVLFHGAKAHFDSAPDIHHSRGSNDFGAGFYCGESMTQAALFISAYPSSCIYVLEFDGEGLNKVRYKVDRKWLLTIAAFRGRMDEYKNKSKIMELREEADMADYIVAPIADNRMFQIIDEFISGVITDEQCVHALAATDLGMQYVIKSKRAAERLSVLEACYISDGEKKKHIKVRAGDLKNSDNKVKAARIRYRGKGKYIDELL